jgi:transposase-like protein
MICANCGREMVRNGFDGDTQKYACFYCGKYTRDDAKPPGRPPKGDRAMTDVERKRLQRERERLDGGEDGG